MEDSIQQYIQAAADLRELIKEAHEVLKDLRTEREAARNQLRNYEVQSAADTIKAAEGIKEEVFAKISDSIIQDFVKQLDKSGAVMNRAAEKHAGLIAASAESLALAIRARDADAAEKVAMIARGTQRSIAKKRQE